MEKENLKSILYESLTFNIYTKVHAFLLSAPIIKYFFNPYKLTPLWHKSFIFKIFEFILKKFFLPIINSVYRIISPLTARISFLRKNFYEHIIGFLILFSSIFINFKQIYIIIAYTMFIWGGILIYQNKDRLFAVSYTAALSIFLIFFAVYNLFFKQEGISSIEFLTPFLLFITASFSLNEESGTEIIESYASFSLVILSALIIISLKINNINPVRIISYANIVTVLMPISLSKAAAEKSGLRQVFMTLSVLILSASAVILSGSISLYTAYSVTFILFVILTKPKFLIYVLLIAPAIIRLAANYVINVLSSHIQYDTPAENIINISRTLWSSSLSEGSKPFINSYNSFTSKTAKPYTPYINESYIKILNILGLIFLIVFLWFVLKSIRACVVTFFKSRGISRVRSAAIVSFLIASSITAIISSNRHNLAVNSLYFLMLASVTSKNRIPASTDAPVDAP